MDISSLTLDELHALTEQIKSEIKRREAQEIAHAKDQILGIAQGIGMSVDAILKTGGKPNKNKQKVAVKYRHPQNSTQEWTGRGRPPKWVKEWTESGRPVEELAIK